MSDIAGLTKESCATGCSKDGCVILGALQSRCAHPLKGGPPIHLLNDPATQVAFDRACVAIGVNNVYNAEKQAS